MITRRDMVTAEFWLVVIILAMACFAASTCQGAATNGATDPRVRVTVVCTDGTFNIGSGVLTKWNDEPRLVLTASHLFDDGVRSISICVQNRGCIMADLVGQDETNDLAAVRVRQLKDYLVLPIAETPPPVGAQVSMSGYGGGPTEGAQTFTGRVVTYAEFGRSPGDGVMLVDKLVRDGDSGGVVLGPDETIVGIISASDKPGGGANGQPGRVITYNSSDDIRHFTVAPACHRIRAFLERLFPRIAARPPPGRRTGPPVGTVPGGVVLPGPAPVAIGPWAGAEPVPGAIPIPKPDHPGGIFPVVPLVPVQPKEPEPKEPGCAATIAGLIGRVKDAEGRIAELTKRPPTVPATPATIEPTTPTIGPTSPIETNPPAKSESGIPWDLIAITAAGALGVGVPTWAVMAYKGARVVKQLRAARMAAPAQQIRTAAIVDVPAATDPKPPSPLPIHLGWDDVPRVQSTRNRYVRVEQTDVEAESYKEAMASWAEANPKTAGTLKRIETLAGNIYHGKQVAARMRPQIDDPQITPQTTGAV